MLSRVFYTGHRAVRDGILRVLRPKQKRRVNTHVAASEILKLNEEGSCNLFLRVDTP